MPKASYTHKGAHLPTNKHHYGSRHKISMSSGNNVRMHDKWYHNLPTKHDIGTILIVK